MVAAMEKALAGVMEAAGCKAMNEVKCRKLLDAARFAEIRTAFASAFPALTSRSGLKQQRRK